MRTKMFLSMLAFSIVLAMSSTAAAETPDVAMIRERNASIYARLRAVRVQADRASPEVKKESERIVAAVEGQQAVLAARLELLELLGRTDAVGERAMHEMTSALRTADRTLSVVESWFRAR